MSMPVNHLRCFLLAALPLILAICLAGLASWIGLQSNTLPTGQLLTLHHALMNLPSESPKSEHLSAETKADDIGTDPFFRDFLEVEPEKEYAEPLILEEIHLSMIAMGKKGRYCLINGKILHEGQSGKGFFIKEIRSDRVFFQADIETFSLFPGQKAAIKSGRVISVEKAASTEQENSADESLKKDAPLSN